MNNRLLFITIYMLTTLISVLQADVYFLTEAIKYNGNIYSPANYVAKDALFSDKWRLPSSSFTFFGAANIGQAATNEDAYSKCQEIGVDLEIGSGWFADIGKKKIKTGVGFFRKPTDFLKGAASIGLNRSSSAQEKLSEGLIGVDVAYIGDGYTVHEIYAPETASQLWTQNMLSFTTKIGDVDISSYFYNRGTGLSDSSLGLNGNTVIGDSLELHLDSKLSKKITQAMPGIWGATSSRNKYWIYDILLGSTYAIDANTSFTLEYNYNGAGLGSCLRSPGPWHPP